MKNTHRPSRADGSRTSGLALPIARKIIELARRDHLPIGAHLPKHQLALAFHVSRSPVRAALECLEARGVVIQRRHRGYFLAADSRKLERVAAALGRHAEDEPYLRIAADRLAGKLPEQFTELELMRHYGVSRAQLHMMLTRMAQEGWLQRKPGYGWKFLPVLTSAEAHGLSYRFRMAIEPAAILEPTFRIDAKGFARARAEQQALVDGRIRELSSAELFSIGSRFHEMIARCSGNPFFHEALLRVNRLRRLIEYRAMGDTERFLQQAREHLRLLDLLEAGERERAAAFLRGHLEVVRAVKSTVLRSGARRRTRPKAEQTGSTAIAMGASHVHF
ncbi:MAG: GntR family transcriptional regulator [Betaproteobacteria bacterium]|nr:GntR family transcriptional regulator [Betaproteobacteria bacterium]